MKTSLMEKQIDWKELLGFIETTFPILESNLERALSDLQTIKPVLSAQNYRPRFSLRFFPRGMIKGKLINNLRDKEANLYYEIECNNIPLLTFQERELKNKQQKISLRVAEIGKKHNLIPYNGIIVSGKVFFKSRAYTFKPKYKEFER